MDFKTYLKRINYTGALTPTLPVLIELQNHHLLAIPFENLDIHYGKKIVLDLGEIYLKVVEGKRGGFCYELNGLFYELLKYIGFQVKRISARVYSEEKGFGQEFDHLAIVVTLDGSDYLADVGFGEFSLSPLRIVLDEEQIDKRGKFKITQHDEQYLCVNKEKDGVWGPEYIFTLRERNLDEYKGMCRYQQTSPDSHFTQNRICSIATENGRISISNDKVKIMDKGSSRTVPITSEQEFKDMLLKYFRIQITKDYCPPIK